jgi:type II secretory pathway component PulJ
MRKLIKPGPRQGEEGLTVIEVTVVTLLLGIVSVIFLNALVSVQNNMATQERRTKNNDQARQAMFSLDREIRSGNLIYNPATESIPNYQLVVYTQANATTRTPPNQCVQWRIDDNKRLVVRRWDPASLSSVSTWQIVAENVVNRVNSVPAFTLSSSGNTVNVVLLTNTRHTPGAKETVRVASSITARNVTPSTNCSTRPAG